MLGLIAWTELPVPVPVKGATLEEIHEAQNSAPSEVIPLRSSDSSAFGTDDPDDLDPDSAAARPWEVMLP